MPAPSEPTDGTTGWQHTWLKPILDTLYDSRVPTMTVASTATTDAALTANAINPSDATAASLSRALPSATAGSTLVVLKTDNSANTVTVSGSLRGVANSTLTLFWQNEAVLLVADSAGSFWPVASHKPKSAFDATYLANGAKGTANGIASLDSTGRLPQAQLPTSAATYASYTDEAAATAAGNAGQLAGVTFVLVG